MENQEKMKRKRDEQKDKGNDPSHEKNDPWSDHLKTQFGPIYPFFQNHEPQSILRTQKVHFD